MLRKNLSMRLMGLLVAVVVVAGAWTEAQARIHSLAGNARFQIGDGLPLPIQFPGTGTVPNGKVLAVVGATIRQHESPGAPDRIVIDPWQLTYPGTMGQVIPVFVANPQVFQVFTQLSFMFPKEKVSFRASGRTGGSVVTFCGKPGSVPIAPGGNPACQGGPGGTGLVRYNKTSNQFGGPAQGNVGFTSGVLDAGNVALNAGGITMGQPPTVAAVSFFNIQPNMTGAGGAPFGVFNMTAPTTPSPGSFNGLILATAGGMPALGIVATVMSPMGPGATNAGTSWGGPFTTGRVTASAPTALGMAEKFTLTGMDARGGPDSTGAISLVAGGFSQRTNSGPNANRGWLNLQVGSVTSHVPLMPAYGIAAIAGLTALTGAWFLRRQKSR